MVHISLNQMQIAGTFTKSITKILVFYSKAPSKTDKGMSFNVQSHDLYRRKIPRQLKTRGTSILGEVRNVEIPGPTQQLLCSKSHDFLAVFALPHSKINEIAYFF